MRWVFIRTDLEKCSFTSLAHQWTLYSEWVPSKRESIQLINHSRPSVNVLRSEKLLCLQETNPSLKQFITSYCCFWLIYLSLNHNSSSSEGHLFWCRRDNFCYWRKCYGLWTGILIVNNSLKWKMSWWIYYKLFRLLVDYCDVFISCLDSFWRHPFTAEEPLVSKWCNATFLKICSDETNSSTSWMANVHFWENYSYKNIWMSLQ